MASRMILGLLMASVISAGAMAKSPFVECAVRTGQNAGVFIRADVNPTINGVQLAPGDEIVLIDSDGVCVGKTVWNNETTSITVWGDDETTPEKDGLAVGERLTFIVFDASENMIYGSDPSSPGRVEYNAGFPFKNEGVYETDALYSIIALDMFGEGRVAETPGEEGYSLSAPAPNPFNPYTAFSLQLVTGQEVMISAYNAIGQQVALIHDGYLAADAQHRFRFDGGYLPSGLYLFRVRGESFAAVKSVVLLK